MGDSDKSTKGHPLNKMQVNQCVTQEYREDGDWNYRNTKCSDATFLKYRWIFFTMLYGAMEPVWWFH